MKASSPRRRSGGANSSLIGAPSQRKAPHPPAITRHFSRPFRPLSGLGRRSAGVCSRVRPWSGHGPIWWFEVVCSRTSSFSPAEVSGIRVRMKPSVRYCAKAGNRPADSSDGFCRSAGRRNGGANTLLSGYAGGFRAGRCRALQRLSVSDSQETWSCTVFQGCGRFRVAVTEESMASWFTSRWIAGEASVGPTTAFSNQDGSELILGAARLGQPDRSPLPAPPATGTGTHRAGR